MVVPSSIWDGWSTLISAPPLSLVTVTHHDDSSLYGMDGAPHQLPSLSLVTMTHQYDSSHIHGRTEHPHQFALCEVALYHPSHADVRNSDS